MRYLTLFSFMLLATVPCAAYSAQQPAPKQLFLCSLEEAFKQLTSVFTQTPEQRNNTLDMLIVLLDEQCCSRHQRTPEIEQSIYNTFSHLFLLELESRCAKKNEVQRVRATMEQLFHFHLDMPEQRCAPFRYVMLRTLLETYRIKIAPAHAKSRQEIYNTLKAKFAQIHTQLNQCIRQQPHLEQNDINYMLSMLLWNIQPYTPQSSSNSWLESSLTASKTVLNLTIASSIVLGMYGIYKCAQNTNITTIMQAYLDAMQKSLQDIVDVAHDGAKSLTRCADSIDMVKKRF